MEAAAGLSRAMRTPKLREQLHSIESGPEPVSALDFHPYHQVRVRCGGGVGEGGFGGGGRGREGGFGWVWRGRGRERGSVGRVEVFGVGRGVVDWAFRLVLHSNVRACSSP